MDRTVSAGAPLWQRRDLYLPLAFVAAGFAPITSLALALVGAAPLSLSTLTIVLPAVTLSISLGVRAPAYGRPALQGYAIGLMAVLAYDATRLPGILSGRWPDFIPSIGALLLQREAGHAGLGYAWRWLGNGAGMGMAFVMAYPLVARRLRVLPAALLFGVVVWGCLIGTLLCSSQAQTLLFRLSPATVAVSLLGHLVFGGMLGLGMAWTGVNLRPYPPDLTRAGVTAAALHRVAHARRS